MAQRSDGEAGWATKEGRRRAKELLEDSIVTTERICPKFLRKEPHGEHVHEYYWSTDSYGSDLKGSYMCHGFTKAAADRAKIGRERNGRPHLLVPAISVQRYDGIKRLVYMSKGIDGVIFRFRFPAFLAWLVDTIRKPV